MKPQPALAFEPAPCPTCGAVDESQAETLCRPSQDQTGEYSCAGEFDDAGRAVRPTAASLAALDAWYEQAGQARRRRREAPGEADPMTRPNARPDAGQRTSAAASGARRQAIEAARKLQAALRQVARTGAETQLLAAVSAYVEEWRDQAAPAENPAAAPAPPLKR